MINMILANWQMKIERKVLLQILHCKINHFKQISASLPGRAT